MTTFGQVMFFSSQWLFSHLINKYLIGKLYLFVKLVFQNASITSEMMTTATSAATESTTKAMSGKDLHAPLIENFKWKLYQCFKKRNPSYSSIKRFETIFIRFVTIYNLAHLGPMFLSYRNQ